MNCDLTIIIPVYNVEKYIIECLDSVYNQEIEQEKYEVLCIDDCGKDNSIELIDIFVKERNIKNLRIIKHKTNKGLSEARNTGIRNAKGKYLMFLDSDDMLQKRCLNRIVECSKENKLDILQFGFIEISEMGIEANISSEISESTNLGSVLSGDAFFSKVCKSKQYIPMVCMRLYKLEYILSQDLFYPNIMFEDEEFSPRILINALRVLSISEKVYIYRRRTNSITTSIKKDRRWFESHRIIIRRLGMFSKEIFSKESHIFLENRIENLTLSLVKNYVIYDCTSDDIKYFNKIIKEEKLYNIPQQSNNLFIKIQGIIMRNPSFFAIMYRGYRNWKKLLIK